MNETSTNVISEMYGLTPFISFPKIGRLNRNCCVTEKLDGSNAQIYIGEDGEFLIGSRSRWITPGKTTDNYGFAAWATENKEELLKLGPGRHFGEWWGKGIQRGYGLTEKRFSLFNCSRWTADTLPKCCSVVPVLYQGPFTSDIINDVVDGLSVQGSAAAPGFMDPEGIVVYHLATKMLAKVTIKNDDTPKTEVKGE